MSPIKMDGVTDYSEGMDVELAETTGTYSGIPGAPRPGAGRLVVKAYNEGGFNQTEVDVLELVAWLKKHRPDLLR